MGRYDSSYGMKQYVGLALSFSSEFLEEIEKEVAVEFGAGATADLIEIFGELLKADKKFLTDKTTAAHSRRAESVYLQNEIQSGEMTLENIYNKFSLKLFGVCVCE